MKKLSLDQRVANYDQNVERQAAERPFVRKPTLCVRCKIFPSLQTSTPGITEALTKLETQIELANASRAEVERFFERHLALVRASKGRYCAHCIDAAISFAMQTEPFAKLPEGK